MFRFSYRMFRRKNRSVEPSFNEPEMPPYFLAVGSKLDEAWQILHHMRNVENPLAVRTNLLSYLFSSARSQISRSVAVARIHGAKSYRDLGSGAKFALFVTYLMFAIYLARLAHLSLTIPGFLTTDKLFPWLFFGVYLLASTLAWTVIFWRKILFGLHVTFSLVLLSIALDCQ